MPSADASPSLLCTVIVPAYQAESTVSACVAALVAQSAPRASYEVVVVDDGSTDATADSARRAGADRVIRIAHGGPAVARNRGVAAALGEILLFTDADCVPAPDWIERMLEPLRGPQVTGVKGTYRTQQTALIARLVQLEFEQRYQRLAQREAIDFVDGYSAGYRRGMIGQAGGFDERYAVPSAEDIDLSFRLAEAGCRLVFAPRAWVRHTHPESLTAYLRRKMRYGYWRALLYQTHPGKLAGDDHTDPWLKAQAVLAVAAEGALIVGFVWPPALLIAVGAAAAFAETTVPFCMWAWQRDRGVALLWPWVTWLRVQLQGIALGWGWLRHSCRRGRR